MAVTGCVGTIRRVFELFHLNFTDSFPASHGRSCPVPCIGWEDKV